MLHATRRAVVATVVLAGVVAVLTLMPPSGLDLPAGADKSYHFLAFAAMAVPISLTRPRWTPVLLLALLTYGALIEVVQPWVGRSREFADLVADGAGALCGIAGGLALRLLVVRLVPPRAGDRR